MVENGAMIDLDSVLNAMGTGWRLDSATAINNNGQIVGYGTNALGRQEAFLLTPGAINQVPVPPTFFFLVFGLMSAWFLRHLKRIGA